MKWKAPGMAISRSSTHTKLLFLMILLSASPAVSQQQKCENNLNDAQPQFTRLLTLHYDGPGAANATRNTLTTSYGACRNIDENAEKMLRYFESFGIDVSVPRRDPFKAYFLRDYDLQPWVVNHRVLLASFYEFGEYFNAPVYRSSWRLVARREFNTRQGRIPKGSALHYGLFRVVFPRREICIDYHSASPGMPVYDGFYWSQTFHFHLYSEQWGRGRAHGIILNQPTRKTLNWVFTFPPEDRLFL